MGVNKKEFQEFFEESREIRSFAIGKKTGNSPSALNPRYIGIYLSNYYSENINKKFHADFLK